MRAPQSYSFCSGKKKGKRKEKKKKRTQGDIQLPQYYRMLPERIHLSLISWESLKEPMELDHWGSRRDREVG